MNLAMGVVTYYVRAKQATFDMVPVFVVLYALNMYFQSFGAVAIVKVNSHWFHVRERGSFGGIFGTLISLGIYFAFDWGGAIVKATRRGIDSTWFGLRIQNEFGTMQRFLRTILGAEGTTHDQTYWVFFIPALLLLVMFVVELFLLKDRPGEAGHQDFDTGDASSGEMNEAFSYGKLFKRILTNPIILTVAAIEFCSGVLRNGVMHWYLIYLKQVGVGASMVKVHLVTLGNDDVTLVQDVRP